MLLICPAFPLCSDWGVYSGAYVLLVGGGRAPAQCPILPYYAWQGDGAHSDWSIVALAQKEPANVDIAPTESAGCTQTLINKHTRNTQTHLHEGLCLLAHFPGYEMISIPLTTVFLPCIPPLYAIGAAGWWSVVIGGHESSSPSN